MNFQLPFKEANVLLQHTDEGLGFDFFLFFLAQGLYLKSPENFCGRKALSDQNLKSESHGPR